MITASFCCNDDNGCFTGKAIRVAFDEYDFEAEDRLWPPSGVTLAMRNDEIKLGRDIWRKVVGGSGGGNIFWLSYRVRGVDAIGMMNYLMRLKYWHCTAGENYLYDQFNAKKLIEPREFFKSREAQP